MDVPGPMNFSVSRGSEAPVTDTDRRRHKRRQAWDKAKEIRDSVDGEDKWRWVIDVAVATGFYSVWMTVFRDDEDMCRRLKQAFRERAEGWFPAPAFERRWPLRLRSLRRRT